MKTPHYCLLFAAVVTLGFAGCATSDDQSSAMSRHPVRFRADDGRTIRIGPSAQADGGWRFKNPHMESCWVADGFSFTNYDVLYLAPSESTAKFHDDEIQLHQWSLETLTAELARGIKEKSVFGLVTTNLADLKPETRTLRMENTILEYSKGGGAARYWAGLYGAGQPILRVRGNIKDGDRVVMSYELRRSGVSGTGRAFGGFMKDETIQAGDIESIVIDLTDFIAAMAGKYTPLR